ncbi:MAG: ankyrin repeat domain-containing protein [Gammaproteobacteria bacterium]
MDKLFELLEEREADPETLRRIQRHLDGNTSITLCSKHTKRSVAYSYGQVQTKTTDTVAMTAFQYALVKGKWQCAKYLLEKDMRALSVFPEDFSTPLHEVARCDNQEFLLWFWNNQAVLAHLQAMPAEKINQRSEEKFTPFMVAIKSQKNIDHITIWSRLLNDYAATDEKGRNILHLAIEAKHTTLVPMLLQTFPGFATMSTTAGAYPVHIAAMHNNDVAMVALSQAGANLHAEDDDFSTPLHWAAKWGHIEIMQFLLQNGAAVNGVNWEKDTAMHVVIKNHHVYVSTNEDKKLQNALSLLLSYGADFYIKNNKNKDAWELAVEHFPSDKARRKEVHEAINEHVQRIPSDKMVASVVNHLKTQASVRFDPNTLNVFCASLDNLAPVQAQPSQLTRLWRSNTTLSSNNFSSSNYPKQW